MTAKTTLPPVEAEEEIFDTKAARELAARARDEALKGGKPVFFALEKRGRRLVFRRWPDGRVEVRNGDGWEAWRENWPFHVS